MNINETVSEKHKPKVGIMSMQRIINYGSFLQSYSLKKNIEELGAEVQFVDYEPGPVLIQEEVKKRNIIKDILDKVKRRILFPHKLDDKTMSEYWNEYNRLNDTFYEEVLPLLGITRDRNLRPELDALVIGSDEVFNCIQYNVDVGYSKELFGYGNRADKLISYAASFGNTTADKLKEYAIYDEVQEMLSGFDHISARDKNTFDMCKGMTDKDIKKNVDPVFLYDYSEEVDQIEVSDKDYIVVYAYANRFSQSEAAEITAFAKKHKKKIKCLCAPQMFIEGYTALKPFEILAYVKNADYVITDTFHGSVFSIKYNKPFATYVRSTGSAGNNEKLNDLLDTFGLMARSVTEKRKLSYVLSQDIDYKKVNQIINEEVSKGKNYLKEALQLGE